MKVADGSEVSGGLLPGAAAVRAVTDDQPRRARADAMSGERLHGKACLLGSRGEHRVIHVFGESDEQVEAGGDALDPATEKVAADRSHSGVAAFPAPEAQARVGAAPACRCR